MLASSGLKCCEFRETIFHIQVWMVGHQHLNTITEILNSASVVRKVSYCCAIGTLFDGFLILFRFPIRIEDKTLMYKLKSNSCPFAACLNFLSVILFLF